MLKYNHTLDLSFTLESDTKDGGDITAQMLRLAIMDKTYKLSDIGLIQACSLDATCSHPVENKKGAK